MASTKSRSKPPSKKLRILLLAHPDLVPPEKPSAADLVDAAWKAEYEVLCTLRELGHEVHVEPLLDDLAALYTKAIEWRPHIAFNLMEEFDGVAQFDQNVVSYLELLKLPYTGCNPRGLMVARDKSLAKKLLSFHGVRTPEFEVFRRRHPIKRPAHLGFPAIVKSLTEEASLGISQASIVTDEKTFLERVLFMQDVVGTDVIVERFIDGRELYVGVLGNLRPEIFPVWELVFPDAVPRVATRRVKWDPRYRKKYRIHSRLAGLPPALETEVQHVAAEAYRLLGLSGYARLDLRLSKEGEIFFIEANPNPHIGREEDFAASAALRGMNYPKLLSRILSLGLRWKTG